MANDRDLIVGFDPMRVLEHPADNKGESEMWESVLIYLADAPLSVIGALDGAEFKLGGKGTAIAVDDLLHDVPADVAFPGFGPGATFTQIAGVVVQDGDFPSSKLAPRQAADLLGYVAP